MYPSRGSLSRRGFLTRSLGALTASGLPVWFANELVQHADAQTPVPNRPNGRINIGVIGTGTNRTRRPGNAGPLRGERGIAIMNEAMKLPGTQIVAVCDVDTPNADFAANIVGRDCRKYTDFRELVRQTDIDAVLIGTPDHWHALIAIAAMKAGKDVYCEKPLTLTLEEGKTLVQVAANTRKIVQTGSQQRSEMGGRFRLAVELVRNGRIGRIDRITTLIGDNPQGGPFAVTPPPEGLDWNFWLGPTPQVPYVKERCHYDFRWWYEYSGGKMTDWGAHHNDVAQWALGMDNSGPISVTAVADPPTSAAPHSYNCHHNFAITYRYGNGPGGQAGTTLVCRAGPPAGWNIRNPAGQVQTNGVLFEGEAGKWIFVNRGFLFASDPRLIDEALPANAVRMWPTPLTNHMANFLEGFRNRTQPICNPTVGHRSCSVCHLGNIALRVGGQLNWDPAMERFTGANAMVANTHLSRPYRDPWKLEE